MVEVSDPEDGQEVTSPEVRLLRVISGEHVSGERPSSQAFQNLEPEKMSAFRADVLEANGVDAAQLLALGWDETYLVVSFSVAFAHECGQRVVNDRSSGVAPGHVHVVGTKSRSVRKAFARGVEWVIGPPRRC